MILMVREFSGLGMVLMLRAFGVRLKLGAHAKLACLNTRNLEEKRSKPKPYKHKT